MPSYACTRCGATSDQRQCPRHRRKPSAHRSPNRDRRAQDRFRQAVLANAGYRCEYMEGQARCPVHGARNLRACHIVPLHEQTNYDPSNGRALCRTHDRMTDRYAR